MSDESPARPYRKRRRAQLEAETRRRITEAAVELHGSVGPARTTISAIADRAGVQRATVYRHFPDDEALYAACSSHWREQHPRPDPAAWAAIDDHDERLRTALTEVYSWFDGAASMLDKTTRDVAFVPALRPPAEAFAAWFEPATDAIVRGRPERGARRRRVRAAVRHAVAYPTWRSLVRDQGLSEREAIDLMATLVECAARA